MATRGPSQYKAVFPRYGDSHVKDKTVARPSYLGRETVLSRSRDRLIFNMGIPILVRRHLYIETAPRWHALIEPLLVAWHLLDPSQAKLLPCPSFSQYSSSTKTALPACHGHWRPWQTINAAHCMPTDGPDPHSSHLWRTCQTQDQSVQWHTINAAHCMPTDGPDLHSSHLLRTYQTQDQSVQWQTINAAHCMPTDGPDLHSWHLWRTYQTQDQSVQWHTINAAHCMPTDGPDLHSSHLWRTYQTQDQSVQWQTINAAHCMPTDGPDLHSSHLWRTYQTHDQSVQWHTINAAHCMPTDGPDLHSSHLWRTCQTQNQSAAQLFDPQTPVRLRTNLCPRYISRTYQMQDRSG